MRDSEIITLLQMRDERGMEEFLLHYGPLMRYIISPILKSGHDVEECVSETAMRVWDKIDMFDEDRGSFTTWLTAITRNTALNKARYEERHYSEEEDENSPSPEMTPEEVILKKERQRELKLAIEQLSSKDKNIFYRKYYYLQPTSKIAAELCMTERAVEGKLYRIRKKLRYLIGGEENEI